MAVFDLKAGDKEILIERGWKKRFPKAFLLALKHPKVIPLFIKLKIQQRQKKPTIKLMQAIFREITGLERYDIRFKHDNLEYTFDIGDPYILRWAPYLQ